MLRFCAHVGVQSPAHGDATGVLEAEGAGRRSGELARHTALGRALSGQEILNVRQRSSSRQQRLK